MKTKKLGSITDMGDKMHPRYWVGDYGYDTLPEANRAASKAKEHPEDRLNRLFIDPVASLIRARLNDGVSFNDIVDGLRSALFHGTTESSMRQGLAELEAEKQAYRAARLAIP